MLKLKKQQTSETSDFKPNKHDSYEANEAEEIKIGSYKHSSQQLNVYKNEEQIEIKPQDAQSMS